VFPFQQQTHAKDSSTVYIVKASSSVLLTLTIPDLSASHDEEVDLLRNPQALWTVLTINSPLNFASEHEPAEYSTPVAQFMRGITASLCTQNFNARSIYDKLRHDLSSCDPGDLFDDELFTKSKLYHRVVKTCEELGGSITSTLRFMKRALERHLKKLCADAHTKEIPGVDYWVQRCEDEMFALEELQSQISLLCSQIQESVWSPL
jgi:hypothetical protein